MEIKKNDCFTVSIEDMSEDGSGIGKLDGYIWFIKDAVKGDVVEAKAMKMKKSYGFARLMRVITPSPDRIEPACSLSQCGGCLFQHITYPAELRIKEKAVQDAFTRIGKLHPEFLPILGAPSRTRYRNKAQYPFASDRSGKPILGFFARRSHRVIPVRDCLLQPELFGEIADTVLDFVQKNRIPVYDETNGTGDMRHLYLRCGQHSGEVMVCFIVRKPIRKKLFFLLFETNY